MREIEIYGDLLQKRPDLGMNLFEDDPSIYVGGGTPSVPDSGMVCDVLRRTAEVFDISENAEKTIEVNPFSFTAQKALDYIEAGFNRISIGVQSLDDKVLKTLGRLHDRHRAIEAIETAGDAGFTNISADLMIGVPGQSLEGIIEDADTLIEHGARHISMYSLTIEEGTPFYERYSKTLEDIVPQETERAMYHGLREHLRSRGLMPYEISNCAIPGYESRHNSHYWRGGEYFAIGAGAHAYIESVRFAHPDDADSYMKAMKAVTSSDFEQMLDGGRDDIGAAIALERLEGEDKMHEYAMLMLRTSGGVDCREFKTRFGADARKVFEQAIDENKRKGLLEDTGSFLRLSKEGLDFANGVFADFLLS